MTSQILKLFLSVSLLFFANSQTAVAFTFKIATLSPDGSYWMQKLREGSSEVSKKTEGRVKFKFYPGGVMGNDKGVLRKMRLRQLHGAAVTNAALSEQYPDIQLYNLVLKFHNLQEIDYIRQNMDAGLMAGLEKTGIISLGFAEVGLTYIMSSSPIQNLDQMRKYKAWVPENNFLALKAMEAFSISPIPLPLRDVLMGLQTGMIDIVAGTPIGALALQWHTKVKYVSDIPLSYVFGILALDQKAFNKISKQDQATVRTVMGRIIKEVDQHSRQDNLKAIEAMKKQGIQFLRPTPEAADELRQTITSVNNMLEHNGKLSSAQVEKLNKHLTEYRKIHP